jgi:hypothetical protein
MATLPSSVRVGVASVRRTRRIVTMLAFALCLAGCDALARSEPVDVRSSDTDTPAAQCYLAGTAAELILDPSVGLAWRFGPEDIRPVIWPRGYTARRVGSEIKVMNSHGVVIARSGRMVEFGFIKFESGVVYGC